MRKQTSRRVWISHLFTISVFLAFAVLLYVNKDYYKELLSLQPLPIIIILLLTIAPDRAILNYWLFRSLGAQLSFAESYGLMVTTTVANQLPIAGGIAAKGYYLKRVYGLPYSVYLAATAFLYLFSLAGAGSIGLVSLIYISYFTEEVVPYTLIGIFVVMTLSPLIVSVGLPELKSEQGIVGIFRRMADGIAMYSADRTLTLRMVGVSAIGIVLLAIRLWAAFRLLSTAVPAEYCLVFSASTLITQLVSFAPGGLGIREGIVAAIGLMAEVDPAISVVAVGIERLLSVGISALLAVGFTRVLGRGLDSPASVAESKD